MTDPDEIRNTCASVRALRDAFGAKSPAGHRCSNVNEMLLNLPAAFVAPKNSTTCPRRNILFHLDKQLRDLASLARRDSQP